MSNYQFDRSARVLRRKAMVFTVLFHVLLFGGIAYSTDAGTTATEFVKEWFQGEEVKQEVTKPATNQKKKKKRNSRV